MTDAVLLLQGTIFMKTALAAPIPVAGPRNGPMCIAVGAWLMYGGCGLPRGVVVCWFSQLPLVAAVQVPWIASLGNHDYRGNITAQVCHPLCSSRGLQQPMSLPASLSPCLADLKIQGAPQLDPAITVLPGYHASFAVKRWCRAAKPFDSWRFAPHRYRGSEARLGHS